MAKKLNGSAAVASVEPVSVKVVAFCMLSACNASGWVLSTTVEKMGATGSRVVETRGADADAAASSACRWRWRSSAARLCGGKKPVTVPFDGGNPVLTVCCENAAPGPSMVVLPVASWTVVSMLKVFLGPARRLEAFWRNLSLKRNAGAGAVAASDDEICCSHC